MDEHKMCPFCGGEPRILTKEIRKDTGYESGIRIIAKYVECKKCHGRTGLVKFEEHGWDWNDSWGENYLFTDKKLWELWDARV